MAIFLPIFSTYCVRMDGTILGDKSRLRPAHMFLIANITTPDFSNLSIKNKNTENGLLPLTD